MRRGRRSVPSAPSKSTRIAVARRKALHPSAVGPVPGDGAIADAAGDLRSVGRRHGLEIEIESRQPGQHGVAAVASHLGRGRFGAYARAREWRKADPGQRACRSVRAARDLVPIPRSRPVDRPRSARRRHREIDLKPTLAAAARRQPIDVGPRCLLDEPALGASGRRPAPEEHRPVQREVEAIGVRPDVARDLGRPQAEAGEAQLVARIDPRPAPAAVMGPRKNASVATRCMATFCHSRQLSATALSSPGATARRGYGVWVTPRSPRPNWL